MTDSRTMDVHIDPYDYTNDIRVNLWLSCDVPFASQYFTKNPGCIDILLSHAHAHYTFDLVAGFVLLSH
jgi:hypothetical protein